MANEQQKAIKEVELGFVEETESWRLRSKYFPSKVGGRPSWLDLRDLPQTDSLECPRCKTPRVFLLQVYAPAEEGEAVANPSSAFHRSVFVFMCKNASCNKRNNADNFCVFRCQLPRENEFYSSEPPDEDDKDASDNPSAEQFCTLCVVCGCLGNKKCGRCHQRTYCSRAHQTIDWKGQHKQQCQDQESTTTLTQPEDQKTNSFLLPEFELVTEIEECNEVENKDEKSDEEKLAEYHNFLQTTNSLLSASDQNTQDLEAMALKNDKMFNKFRKKVANEPEQVLRYQRGGEPLWVSADNIPHSEQIPKCQCGADRQFEFQIMPQLLNFLQLDQVGNSVDWGTLVIYTCSKSCDMGLAYKREFIWKQDFSNPERNVE